MRTKSKEPPRSTHPCSVAGCLNPGEYKAPKSRYDLGEYRYLCLDHIREFNKAWDYFDGWNQEQIETFMHSAGYGHRPTWKIGMQPLFTSDALRDSFFKMLGEEPPTSRSKPEKRTNRKERDAYSLLNLEPGADKIIIKSEYKKLVKKYHPDVNKSKEAEETFKQITAAYKLLMESMDKHEE